MLEVHESKDDIKIIMEYKSGGNLRDYMNNHKNCLDTDTVKHLAIQICLGLSVIHSKKIIHRDIKLENILVDNCSRLNGKVPDIVISDFGFAIRNTKEDILGRKRCGTPGYAPPEIFKSR